MQSNIIPEGFKDDVSFQVAAEHRYKNIIIDCFQANGFELVKTPLIEHLNINTDENVFKILVNKKEKKLNIRDDITLQVARLSQTRLLKKKKPLNPLVWSDFSFPSLVWSKKSGRGGDLSVYF